MVSVSDKTATHRVAVVSGQVVMKQSTADLIVKREFGKGDVIEVARLAGIMASKRTSELIPLCHPIALDSVDLKLAFAASDSQNTGVGSGTATLVVSATVVAEQKTGVEMEAFTAVSIACLTVYDMCKSATGPCELLTFSSNKSRAGRAAIFAETRSWPTDRSR